MPNFFLDNQDILFLFDHIDLQEIAAVQELHAENEQADYCAVGRRGRGRQLPPHVGDRRGGGGRHDCAERGVGGSGGQYAQRERHGHIRICACKRTLTACRRPS